MGSRMTRPSDGAPGNPDNMRATDDDGREVDTQTRLTTPIAIGDCTGGQIGITREQCHVGMFDVEQCKQVVEICAPYTRRLAA